MLTCCTARRGVGVREWGWGWWAALYHPPALSKIHLPHRHKLSLHLCPVLMFLSVYKKLKEQMKEQEQQGYWQEKGRWVGYEESFDPQAQVWVPTPISCLTFRSLIQLRHTMSPGQWAKHEDLQGFFFTLFIIIFNFLKCFTFIGFKGTDILCKSMLCHTPPCYSVIKGKLCCSLYLYSSLRNALLI